MTTNDADELAALRARVRQLEDNEAIRALIARYSCTADLGRFDDWRRIVTDDFVWQSTSFDADGQPQSFEINGGDAAQELLAGPGHAAIVMRELHHITNLLVEVDGDEAQAIGQLAQTLRGADGAFGFGTCRMMSYTLRRVDGHWRIAGAASCETGGPAVAELPSQDALLSMTKR